MTNIAAQISALSNQVAALVAQKNTSTVENVVAASTSQGPKMSIEQAQYMANEPYNNNYQGNPMPNYYHPGLRNHENLSYGNTKNLLQPPPGFNAQQQPEKKSLEDILGTFMMESSKRFNKNEVRLENIETHISNMDASMKNIEIQVGQLAKAIALRSAKVVDGGQAKDEDEFLRKQDEPMVREVDKEEQVIKQNDNDKSEKKTNLPMYQPPIPYPQ
uniref:Uncharacterized protein n=1 Tax=Cannabis sativa TaxID=3483 RepID=A0A803P9R0_CANSA